MPNAFDDPDAAYLVLVNHSDQRSLWPTFAEVPNGWTVVHGPDRRDECLRYVIDTWTDLRPSPLRQAGAGSGGLS